MTRDEAEAIYDQGKEAVIALLLKMDATINPLAARVQALEDRLSKDSHNSSKPPSRDPPFRPFKKPQSLQQKSGKKSGGQPGHAGKTLRPSDTPDHVHEYAPLTCQGCGHSLADQPPARTERRQVFELPPLRLQVTEHRAHTIVCPGCGCANAGRFPRGVAQPVQYGPGLSGLCVYLQQYHLLPFERLSELLCDLFGAAVGEGTLWSLTRRCQSALAPVQEAIRSALVRGAVLHSDETGMRLGKRLAWLHVYSTERLTLYAWHKRRGKAAMQEIGVLPACAGTAIHDGWNGYFAFANCSHALCGAHLLRDLVFVEERFGQAGIWAKAMKSLLQAMKAGADLARASGHAQADGLDAFLSRYAAILQGGYGTNPDPPSGEKASFSLCLLDRFRDWRTCICRFAEAVSVPFDNNQAERDLRMAKVRQKVSGCFRSEAGADAFCVIRGYLSTLKKQGIALLPALQSAFEGRLTMPALA